MKIHPGMLSGVFHGCGVGVLSYLPQRSPSRTHPTVETNSGHIEISLSIGSIWVRHQPIARGGDARNATEIAAQMTLAVEPYHEGHICQRQTGITQ
jgi:hypothetical protein